MKSKKTLYILLAITVILIIFAIIGKKAGWFGAGVEIEVAVDEAEKRTLVETITANGKIQPETQVKISPDVSGEIVDLQIKEGDKVEAGDFLLKIQPDTYISMRDRAEAAVNTARANLANAKARLAQVKAQFVQAELAYKRSKTLWEQKTISESEWETAESQYLTAKAEVEAAQQNVNSAEFSVRSASASLEEAQENLRRTSLFAPMEGTVSQLNVEKGERVVGTEMMAGTEMLTIADLSRMEVEVEVNENDIVRVSLRDTAIIEVDAYLDEKFKGVVTEIANSANTTDISADQVTNFDVTILILESSYSHLLTEGVESPFRPGMSATVDIQTNKKYDILTIPIQAVTTRTDSVLRDGKEPLPTQADSLISASEEELNEIVFVNENNKAVVRVVSTGIQDNMHIEILSGLNPGEKVITAPFSAISRRLQNGINVVIKDEQQLFKADD